jgi:hypothetical protein
MASLSQWLQLMLEEIARKREAEQGAREEALRRRDERAAEQGGQARANASPATTAPAEKLS